MPDSTIAAGAVLLGLAAVIAIALILTHRVSWRIAIRNVRRGRGRTVLLLLGLLVGTTIISGSLVVGSTVQALDVHYTYIGAGNVHEAIYGVSAAGGFGAYAPIAYSTYSTIASQSASNSNIAATTPMIIETTQVYDKTTGIPETALNLIASDANQSANLGQFTTTAGATSPGPGTGQVFIDVQTAQALGAHVGDTLMIFGPQGIPPAVIALTAIVNDDDRGGYITAGATPGNVFLSLGAAQALENLSGEINFIAVTNVGGQQGGIAHSDSVSAFLNTTLAQIPSAAGLKVHEPLKNAIASAETSGMSIETIFLVLGLFSIAAGGMLIVGIFLMLAEERKGEMGMLRAVGMRRRELVLVYYFEGLVYAAGSALAGTALGVATGYVLTYVFSTLFASGGVTSAAILQSFTVTPDDLVISYVAGFLLTIITVAIASSRVSRLNIVAAIRDIPPSPPPVRFYTFLLYIGLVVTAIGALLFFPNARGTSDISIPTFGGGLLIIGLGLIASRFVRNRIAFTGVGLGLVLWAGLEPLRTAVLGSAHTGGIFTVFTDGILMVMGALIAYVFNSVAVTSALLRLAGSNNKGAPVSRVALSYPARRSGRTAVTLAIFALVTFTMVAIACFGSTIEANLNNTIVTESGGYSFIGFSSQPIPDLPGQVANNTTLAREFSVVVPLLSGTVAVNVTGSSPNPYTDSAFAAPGNRSPTSDFYSTNQYTFSSTWHGMSRAQVFQELQTNASVAIVDGSYAPPTASVNGGPTNAHPTLSAGALIGVVPLGAATGLTVRVIGIMTQVALTGVWLNPGAANRLGFSTESAFLMSVHAGISTTTAAQDAKRAFFAEGLLLFDINAIIQSSIASTEGVIGLLEIFVGLGLAVGIAAMGILALRAVVERRREIGMLRAMGFKQGAILRAFFLEYSFVTLLGLGIGTALGVLIVYNLSISPSAAAAGVSFFSVPVLNIVVILLAAYALSMLAIAAPSIRASRMPPAEAVRPTE